MSANPEVPATQATAQSDAGTPVQPTVADRERPRGPDGVFVSWEPGDVLVDLYEVRRLDEARPYVEGGMGRVNRVWHHGWQQDLAVKSVNPQYLQRPGAVEQFQREAEVWVNKLNLHPHLVFCYYVRLLGGLPRVFVEYIDGGDLAQWVESGKLHEGGPSKALERILDIAIQFAWGLHAIHAQGLVHQDVKPRNLLMTQTGIAKVTDFGIARARAAAESAIDVAGLRPDVTALAGTRAYQSPEQAAGQRLTPATDVWSWAVSVLDLFVGRVERGFGAGARHALEQYAAAGTDDRCPAMPSPLLEVLRHCFRSRPDERPGSMLQVAAALRDIYQQMTGQPYPRAWVEPAEALADSLNNRALSLYDSLDKRQEAEAKWQEALRVDSYHSEATYNLGLLQWRSGRITDEHLLAKLRQVRPSCADPARVDYLLGLVHLERNDPSAAIEVLSRTAAAAGSSVEMASALALAKAHDTGSPHLLRTFEGHTERVLAAAWSPDGCFVTSSSADGTLAHWEASSGRRLRFCWGEFYALAFSPDGRFLLSGGVYPHSSKTRVWRRGFDGRFYLAYWYAVGGGMVGLWEAATGSFLRDLPRNGIRLWGGGSRRGHREIVTAVAWSPDGHFALSTSEDRMRLWKVGSEGMPSTALGRLMRWLLSRLWKVRSDQCMRVLKGHKGIVHALVFSPDGSQALSCGADVTVRLWEVSSGRCLRSLEGPTGASASTAWRPDSHFALADPLERSWWRTKSSGTPEKPQEPMVTWTSREAGQWEQKPVPRPKLREGPTSYGTAAAWSPDGRFVLSGGWDEVVRLWEVSGGPPRIWAGHKDTVTAVAWSADGRLALSGSADHTLRLWEVSSGRCLRTLEGHTDTVTSVVWGRDGRLALAASADHTLRLWHVAPAGPPMPLVPSRPSPARSDYRRLLDQAREALAAGEPARAAGLLGRARQEPGCTRRAEAMELARQLSGTLTRGAFRGGWERQVLTGHGSAVTTVSFSPDGFLALSGGPTEAPRLWEVSSGRCQRTFGEQSAGATALTFSPEGDQALSGGEDRRLRLWEVSSGRCLRSFEGHKDSVTAVAWGPDGRSALSACRDKRVRLWEIGSGRCLRSLHGGLLVAMTHARRNPLAPHRPAMAFIDEPSEWGLWCAFLSIFLAIVSPWVFGKFVPQGVFLRELLIFLPALCLAVVGLLVAASFSNSHKDQATTVAWGPDGRLAVSGGADKQLRLWKVSSGRCLRTFKGHTDTVTAAAWSPDGQFVLSGSGDRTMRLWEVSSGRCLRIFAHKGCVTSLAWSPDGRFALTGGADRTVLLWEVFSGRCLHTFEGHTNWVTSVAFSPDGWQALSGSADHTVRLWQLDWELGGGR
jgi:WD40 repeat protein/serine/threonine protein kinase